jgi:hypothetical protein
MKVTISGDTPLERRYQTMGDMVVDLRRALRHKAAGAAEPMLPELAAPAPANSRLCLCGVAGCAPPGLPSTIRSPLRNSPA